MKRALVVFAALVSVSLLGCGGSTVDAEVETPAGDGSTVSQSAICTARCDGGQTVSCSAATCSATDYSGVNCNGVFTPCPSSCSYQPCSNFQGACGFPGGVALCCDGGAESRCACTSAGFWDCI